MRCRMTTRLNLRAAPVRALPAESSVDLGLSRPAPRLVPVRRANTRAIGRERTDLVKGRALLAVLLAGAARNGMRNGFAHRYAANTGAAIWRAVPGCADGPRLCRQQDVCRRP